MDKALVHAQFVRQTLQCVARLGRPLSVVSRTACTASSSWRRGWPLRGASVSAKVIRLSRAIGRFFKKLRRRGDGPNRANISTGRTEPRDLREQLAMEEVRANPSGTTPERMPEMSDSANDLHHADGRVKRVQNVNGVEIHYAENINTNEVIDFKFVGE